MKKFWSANFGNTYTKIWTIEKISMALAQGLHANMGNVPKTNKQKFLEIDDSKGSA